MHPGMMTVTYEVESYIEYVRSGKVPVCKEQLALCNHVENCFEEEDIYVDEQQLKRYLGLQQYFPFRLLPWETFLFALHNCTYQDDGELRWPILFLYGGRGFGKNGYESFESFAWSTPINGVQNYDVDIFATSEDQAKTSPDDIRSVLEENKKKLEKYFKWNVECITNLKTGSRIRFRTSSYKTKDGGRPGAVVFDEYHAYENYKMVDVATTGLGKKKHPRKTIITTDGYIRGGPLDDLKEQARGVLFRGQDDGGMLPFMCHLDSIEEVDKPDMWVKANPSLAYPEFGTLLREIKQEYATYKNSPNRAASFVVKRMNMPAEQEDEDVTTWENVLAASRPLPDLAGCPCVAAIDYAKTQDLIAAGLLFKKDDVYYWITHSWICKNSLDLPRIKAPLEEWEAKDLLTFVDAPEVSPEIPTQWVEEQARIYQTTVMGMDNFRYTLLSASLKQHGFDTDKGGRNNIRLTKRVTQMRWAPVIASAFATQRIVWGNNPLMRWYTWNTCVATDKDGNMVYQKKEEKSRKTDGFMALVHAFCASEDLPDCGNCSGDYEEVQIYSY